MAIDQATADYLDKKLQGLSPQSRERALKSVCALVAFLRRTCQHGYSGAFAVTIESGTIEQVVGRFGDGSIDQACVDEFPDPEAANHVCDFFDWREQGEQSADGPPV